ncbi:MAG: DUF502 domain-containing protein, partial [Rhodospirillaceae bacterium]|nr:DUF502 domain-containing protein [Rhodospirillaceae bacterium]
MASSDSNDKNDPANTGPNPKTGRQSLGSRMRNYFLAGILVTAPITITLYAAWLFVSFVDDLVTSIIPVKYSPSSYLPFDIPGLGLVMLVVTLILVGWLAAGFLGRFFLRTGEKVVDRMPVIRSIYGAIKQIFETVIKGQSSAFRDAVLVEYPRRGIWAIAFLTGRTKGEVQNLTEEEVINVFLPTTPNPTSGFLLFVPKKDMVPLSMSVE